MMLACNLITQIAEAKETGVQGHSQLTANSKPTSAIYDIGSSLKEGVWLADSIFFTEKPTTSCNPSLLHPSISIIGQACILTTYSTCRHKPWLAWTVNEFLLCFLLQGKMVTLSGQQIGMLQFSTHGGLPEEISVSMKLFFFFYLIMFIDSNCFSCIKEDITAWSKLIFVIWVYGTEGII